MSRTFWIDVFLFLHVLGAIVAVGPTMTYAMWAQLGQKAGQQQRAFAVNGINWVDSHLATPAFMVQAVTGIALILLLEISFLHTAWLLVGVGIYVVVTVLAVTVLTPVVKRQIDLAERTAADPGNESLEREFADVVRRIRTIGFTVGFLTLAIVFFMVVKPELWSAG
ncbi:MAG TPA: DUF2269 family protein [Actinomycetota bacterium]|nr:DUF2269 family protein [Actinomycetota bacterium]